MGSGTRQGDPRLIHLTLDDIVECPRCAAYVPNRPEAISKHQGAHRG